MVYNNKPRNATREKSSITIGQINAQNSNAVIDQLRQTVQDMYIDILCIQEPYSYRNKITGMGISNKVISDTKTFTSAVVSKTIKAAIVVTNPTYTVLKIEQFSNTHFACAEITVANHAFYIVNAYFQYSDKIEPYLEHLDKILAQLRNRKLILCFDANAYSNLWHSKETDDRGEILEQFIAQHELYILNQESNITTFDNTHGQSNIDITLANSTCYNRIRAWKVHAGKTTSDHNLITFKVDAPEIELQTPKENRFNIKKANWEKFTENLRSRNRDRVRIQDTQNTNVNDLVHELEDIIKKACLNAIPLKTQFLKSAPWWNINLTKLRKQSHDANRKLRLAKGTTKEEQFKIQYNAARNRYNAQIRRSKNESWRNFVTKEANSDPWGLVYKLQTNKIKIDQAFESIKHGDQQSTTWEHTANILLSTLVPDDDLSQETRWHRSIRHGIETPPDTENTPSFEPMEIQKAIKSLKNNKAPGHDRIETEMIKIAWSVLEREFCALLNKCLASGVFPDRWKQGVIRVLLKAEDKDKTKPGSYRPICLLPALSKILEKLIASRLLDLFHRHPLAADRQYGFKSGKSTEDAIFEMRRIVGGTNEKYIIALLFDIKGAFDNVWWPSILKNLKERGCPKNLYTLIRSYLQNRKMKIKSNNMEVEKTATKGCPQGSILGPYFWNLVFDEIIRKIKSKGSDPIAYADDLLVLITGNSRRELEIKANSITELIVQWCKQHKLQLSEAKSEMLLVKGFLDTRRPPTVKIGQISLKMPQSVRYLGLHFGPRLNVTPHVKQITDKSKKIFNRLACIAKAHWGVGFKSMLILYRGIFEAIISYAATGWSDKVNTHHLRKLTQAQRYALLRVTKAYRTISNEALVVLVGATPINLLLQERIAVYKMKNNISFEIGDLHYQSPNEPPGKQETKELKQQIRSQIISKWQTTWENSTKGRLTYEFINNIEQRLKSQWIKMDFHTAQLMSGHGKMKHKLYTLKIAATDKCRCGQSDTVKHIIYECPHHDEPRCKLKLQIEQQNIHWPCELHNLVEENTFPHFKEFVTQAMKDRETWYNDNTNNATSSTT